MIILLNGSPRRNGATALILKNISARLQKQGLETEFINASDLKLRHCIGCGRCYKTGKCIYDDDIEKLSRKIKCADGVIIGTPTYASNISGQLKTIVDRGHFVMEQLLYKKYAMSVVTYENYGGKDTSKILNKMMLYSGAYVSGSLIVKSPFSQNPLDNEKIAAEVREKTQKYIENLKNQRKPHFQTIKHFLIFHLGIVPFVKRKGEDYRGVINAWEENGVLLNKKE